MRKQVHPDDPLSRFLFERKKYAPKENRVKPNAFMPAPDLKLSVFQTKDLSSENIWKIGNEIKPENKRLHGRGDIIARSVYQEGLEVIPDNTPPLHANISGWPEDRTEQRQIANNLAADAELCLYNQG